MSFLLSLAPPLSKCLVGVQAAIQRTRLGGCPEEPTAAGVRRLLGNPAELALTSEAVLCGVLPAKEIDRASFSGPSQSDSSMPLAMGPRHAGVLSGS